MSELAALRAMVHGHVQGVFFRAFTARCAAELGLTGYVRNLPSGMAVEVQAEGERSNLEKLVDRLQAGPPGARVEKVVTDWSQYTGQYAVFKVRY